MDKMAELKCPRCGSSNIKIDQLNKSAIKSSLVILIALIVFLIPFFAYFLASRFSISLIYVYMLIIIISILILLREVSKKKLNYCNQCLYKWKSKT